MKKKLDRSLLIALVLGALGALLNLAVVLSGKDAQGLAKPGYLPGILLMLLVPVCIALPVIRFWGLKARKKYLHLFAPSLPAAAALAAAALALLITGSTGLRAPETNLILWRSLTGILGSLALGYCAGCRYRGIRPVWIAWALVTVHLVLVLISNYQFWSRQTVLADYAIQLLACVSLMLCAYQQSAADGGMGNLKEYLTLSLICVALCPIAMVGSSHWLVYLCFCLYHALNLYSLNLKGE